MTLKIENSHALNQSLISLFLGRGGEGEWAETNAIGSGAPVLSLNAGCHVIYHNLHTHSFLIRGDLVGFFLDVAVGTTRVCGFGNKLREDIHNFCLTG